MISKDDGPFPKYGTHDDTTWPGRKPLRPRKQQGPRRQRRTRRQRNDPHGPLVYGPKVVPSVSALVALLIAVGVITALALLTKGYVNANASDESIVLVVLAVIVVFVAVVRFHVRLKHLLLIVIALGAIYVVWTHPWRQLHTVNVTVCSQTSNASDSGTFRIHTSDGVFGISDKPTVNGTPANPQTAYTVLEQGKSYRVTVSGIRLFGIVPKINAINSVPVGQKVAGCPAA